jgi:hypothetical protein
LDLAKGTILDLYQQQMSWFDLAHDRETYAIVRVTTTGIMLALFAKDTPDVEACLPVTVCRTLVDELSSTTGDSNNRGVWFDPETGEHVYLSTIRAQDYVALTLAVMEGGSVDSVNAVLPGKECSQLAEVLREALALYETHREP